MKTILFPLILLNPNDYGCLLDYRYSISVCHALTDINLAKPILNDLCYDLFINNAITFYSIIQNNIRIEAILNTALCIEQYIIIFGEH